MSRFFSTIPSVLALAGLLALQGCGGGSSSATNAAPTSPAPPSIASFLATPGILTQGGSSQLSAHFSNGTGTVHPGGLAITSGHAIPVTPALTTSYTLTVTNPAGGTASMTTLVTVVAAPTITGFTAGESVVRKGMGTSLTATFADGTGVIDHGIGPVISGQSVPTGALDASTTFTLTVTNGAGTATTRTLAVTVEDAPAITAFTASPAVITLGGTSTLAFSFAHGTGAIDQGIGGVLSGGTRVVDPVTTTTYTLRVIDASGASQSQSVTVTVVPAPAIASFSANPPFVQAGSASELVAVFSGGTARVDQGIGPVASGTPVSTGPLVSDATFTLTVTNAAGDARTLQTSVAVATFETLAAGGRVLLPPGSALSLGELRVQGALDESPLDSLGNFTVKEADSGPAPVVLVDSADRPILLGTVDGGRSDGEVSARQTAVALLFHALGGETQPISLWPEARAFISASPQAAQVAQVIADAVAANPLALFQGDPRIRAAVQEAAEALAPAPASPLRRQDGGSAPLRVDAGTATLTGASGARVVHVKVDGENPRSGVSVSPSTKLDGILLRNEFRRHLLVFVYRTGWEDKDGNYHDLPWELVSENSFAPLTNGKYVGAVSAVGGAVPSLIELFFSKGAYVAKDVDIPLVPYPAPDPDSVQKTFFKIVVVGRGHTDSEEVTAPPGLNPVKGEVEYGQGVITAFGDVKEVILPILFSLIPAKTIVQQTDYSKEYVQMCIDILSVIRKGTTDVVPSLAKHKYGEATLALAKALSNNKTLLTTLGRLAAKIAISRGVNEATVGKFAGYGQKVLALLSVVDKLITGYDLQALTRHVMQSNYFDTWEAQGVHPNVRIQPLAGKVKAGKKITLSATSGAETGGANAFYKFTWTTLGAHGLLGPADGSQPPSKQIVISSREPGSSIQYEADPLATPGEWDWVKVNVTRVEAGADEKTVGNATATVTIGGSQVNVTPGQAVMNRGGRQAFTAEVIPKAEVGDTYVYRWSNSALHGHLAGGSDIVESATATTVTYEADATGDGGVDFITLEVFKEKDGQRESLGQAAGLAIVKATQVVLTPNQATIDLGGTQAFTASVQPGPEPGETYVYHWSNTAGHGHLAGGKDDFESASAASVSYVADPTGDGGEDSISLEVFREKNGLRDSLGKASATVTVNGPALKLTPEDRLLFCGERRVFTLHGPAAPAGKTLSYRWTCTGTVGQLLGSTTTTVPNITYLANGEYRIIPDTRDFVGKGGNDTLAVEVLAVGEGETTSLGKVSITVVVWNKLPQLILRPADRWVLEPDSAPSMTMQPGESVTVSVLLDPPAPSGTKLLYGWAVALSSNDPPLSRGYFSGLQTTVTTTTNSIVYTAGTKPDWGAWLMFVAGREITGQGDMGAVLVNVSW